MKEWWAILTWQQAVASVLYGVAVFLMLVSLPLPFMIRIHDDPISTWDLLIQLGSAFYHMPEMWMSGSWTDFVQNALPALCLLLAYVLIVPGAILMILSSMNRWLSWVARLLWSVIWIAGPVLILNLSRSENLELSVGGQFWIAWTSLVVVAHWTMAPCQLAPKAPGGVAGMGQG